MNVKELIKTYITTQPGQKRLDMEVLHKLMLKTAPGCKLWFHDGRNEQNKIVSNPNIGYGAFLIKYAGGKTKEWFRIGISANTTGISVYILGLADKTYLAKTFGKKIGKASLTGYCIKFKSLKDINIEVLEAAIRYGMTAED